MRLNVIAGRTFHWNGFQLIVSCRIGNRKPSETRYLLEDVKKRVAADSVLLGDQENYWLAWDRSVRLAVQQALKILGICSAMPLGHLPQVLSHARP